MKKKRTILCNILIWTLTLVLLLPLSGCREEAAKEESSDSSQPAQEGDESSTSDEEPIIDGGFHDHTDREAPKEIKSKDIVEFSATFREHAISMRYPLPMESTSFQRKGVTVSKQRFQKTFCKMSRL